MGVNSLTFEQGAAFLMDWYEQATGKKPELEVIDTGSFVSVGTTLLQMGTDVLTKSLTQLLAKSIYSIRPYSQKFKSINVDEQKWGAVVRKINYIDGELEDDPAIELVDGESPDQWKVNKPKMVQTNFYGAYNFARHITIFTYQMDAALRDPAEFNRWLAGVYQNMADQLAQIEEGQARSILANFITSKYKADTPNAINVLQAYYDETGVALTPVTMFEQKNYPDFIKWLYSFINNLTDFMSERSEDYHMNIKDKPLMRHTPLSYLKAYMSGNILNKTVSEVMATIFNPEKLKMVEFEKVTYWQNKRDPYAVSASPTYLKTADGGLKTETDPVVVRNILGCLFDVAALGTCRRHMRTYNTQINAAGEYFNVWYHGQISTWNDFTENFILLYAEAPTVPSVTLSDETLTLAPEGTDTLIATTVPEGATVTFTSSDETVATVDEDGEVTGVAEGEATITATIVVGGRVYSDKCVVTVTS